MLKLDLAENILDNIYDWTNKLFTLLIYFVCTVTEVIMSSCSANSSDIDTRMGCFLSGAPGRKGGMGESINPKMSSRR